MWVPCSRTSSVPSPNTRNILLVYRFDRFVGSIVVCCEWHLLLLWEGRQVAVLPSCQGLCSPP